MRRPVADKVLSRPKEPLSDCCCLLQACGEQLSEQGQPGCWQAALPPRQCNQTAASCCRPVQIKLSEHEWPGCWHADLHPRQLHSDCCCLLQARAEQLSEHEDSLDAWKQRFRAEALRQIGEREDGLNEWQAKLSRRQQELEDMQLNMEVGLAVTADSCLSLHRASLLL